uniref:putative protein FAM90A23P n=1 Tax=Jaculus jaculus TaxID=51337 RepID=UPI001E1B12EB|nr:putative protein FAM90A23P [Jaculus jaculus]
MGPEHRRAMRTPNVPRNLRASEREKMPPRVEEDPSEKCRDCGAFGHTSRSRRCPIKRWEGAMAPQPLGSRRDKENRDTRQTQRPQNSGIITHCERQKGQAKRQEEQHRTAYCQNVPMQSLRRKQQSQHATRLRSINTHVQTPELDVIQTSQPLMRKSEESSLCPVVPPRKSHDGKTFFPLGKCGVPNPTVSGVPKAAVQRRSKNPALESVTPERHSLEQCHEASEIHGTGQALHPTSATQIPDGKAQHSLCPLAHTTGQFANHSIWTPGKRPSQVPIKLCQNPPKVQRLNSPEANEDSSGSPSVQALQVPQFLPQVSPKVQGRIPAEDPSSAQQLPNHRVHLDSPHPCSQAHAPSSSSSPVPRPPIRMVFTRVQNDCWSSRFLSPSPVDPPEKQALPAKNQTFLQKSESPCIQVPLSVLYEDLQVSSSSEESD